jgi:hypothetical protein
MSGRIRPLPEPSADTLLRDDQFLDALGRGESPAADGDQLLLALAQWRTEIGAKLPTVDVVLRAAAIPEIGWQPAPPRSRRRSRARRTARLAAVVAGITAVLGGGLTAAAAAAQPGSLLWPITEIVYGDHASSVLAVSDLHATLGQAREAIAQQRYADAETLLTRAEDLIARVLPGTERDALVKELAEVRALLKTNDTIAGTPPTQALPPASSTPATSAPAATPAPNLTTSRGPGLLPLPLPTLPAPTLPHAPLPSLTLPDLPLPR